MTFWYKKYFFTNENIWYGISCEYWEKCVLGGKILKSRFFFLGGGKVEGRLLGIYGIWHSGHFCQFKGWKVVLSYKT